MRKPRSDAGKPKRQLPLTSIPDNPEYRKFVRRILEDKRRRDVINDILAEKGLAITPKAT